MRVKMKIKMKVLIHHHSNKPKKKLFKMIKKIITKEIML